MIRAYLVNFSRYFPHILSVWEHEFSNLPNFKPVLPKGPQTVFKRFCLEVLVFFSPLHFFFLFDFIRIGFLVLLGQSKYWIIRQNARPPAPAPSRGLAEEGRSPGGGGRGGGRAGWGPRSAPGAAGRARRSRLPHRPGGEKEKNRERRRERNKERERGKKKTKTTNSAGQFRPPVQVFSDFTAVISPEKSPCRFQCPRQPRDTSHPLPAPKAGAWAVWGGIWGAWPSPVPGMSWGWGEAQQEFTYSWHGAQILSPSRHWEHGLLSGQPNNRF